MASLAGCREPGRNVVGARRLLEIRQVARDTIRRSACKFIIHVALTARDGYVGTGESEARGGVIKLSSGPLHRRMTGLTCSRKSGGHVVRVRRLREVSLVATDTRCRSSSVLAADVTLRALHGGMYAGQRERRVVVIECRRNPAHCRVTNLALRWQASSLVIGIDCVVVIREMARNAG